MTNLLQQIDSNTKLVQDLFGHLTPEQLNENDGAHWSIAQNIVYELDTVFEIIIQHELRHIEQAKEQLQRILMD